MAVNYVICAAGEGSRFRPIFRDVPKPLITIYGKSMLEWALESIDFFEDDTIIIITLANHRVKEKLYPGIKNRYPFINIKWHEIDKITRGQLETAIIPKESFNLDASIAIYNCDNYFQSRTLQSKISDASIEGIIPCFEADGTAWSFCAIDKDDNVCDIREKERISNWATIGYYFFRDTRKFIQRAEEALSENSNSEYYVAPLYQEYIKAGERVVIDRLPLAKPMGTPEQVESYWDIRIDDVAAENVHKTLVIDIDDTITIEEPGTPYPDKRPHKALISKIQEYKRKGYEIILLSARRMVTCKNDESKVLKKTGAITLEWLKRHEVPFDGLRFGKPYANNGFYIDDKTIRPSEFLELAEDEIFDLLGKERNPDRK